MAVPAHRSARPLLRSFASLALVGLAAMGLASCAPTSPNDVACDDFMRMSPEQQTELAAQLDVDDFAIYLFSESGVEEVSRVDLLKSSCSPGDTLWDAAQTSRSTAVEPTCLQYAAITDPEVRRQWAEVFARIMDVETEIPLETADGGCKADPDLDAPTAMFLYDENGGPIPAGYFTAFGITHGEGYTADIVIKELDIAAVSDVQKAPPGFVDISFTTDGSAWIENTTEGRDLPSAMLIEFMLILPLESPACAALLETDFVPKNLPFCVIEPVVLTPASVPLADESITLRAADTPPIAFRVEEANAEAIVDELNAAPIVIAIGAFNTGAMGWAPTEPVCESSINGFFDKATFLVAYTETDVICA
jgi:hypothetical protein